MERFPTVSNSAPRERTRVQRIYDRARQIHIRNALSRIALQASGEPTWLRRLRRDTLLRHWWELGNEA